MPGSELVPVAERSAAEIAMMRPETDSWSVVFADVVELTRYIADSDFVPKSHRGKPGQVAAVILHGRELGLAPMSSLAGTHVIEGRPAISAEMMRSLVLAAGHKIAFPESTSARVIIKGRRLEDEEWTTVEWTIADAQRAGVAGKDVWKKYPRAMLVARATVELCRMIFADVIHGIRAVEELEDIIDAEVVESPAAPAAAAGRTTVRRTRAQQPAAEAQDVEQPPAQPQERRRPALPARGQQAAPQTADGDAAAAPQQSPSAPDADQQTLVDAEESEASREDDAADSGVEEVGGEPTSSPPTPDEDIVDADVVDDQPAEKPADELAGRRATGGVRARGPKPQMITAGQRGGLMGQFKRLGIDDRDERLIVTAFFAGVDKIESSNKLTFDQASTAMDRLSKLRDRAALDKELES